MLDMPLPCMDSTGNSVHNAPFLPYEITHAQACEGYGALPSIHQEGAGRCQSRGQTLWPAADALTASSWTAPALGSSAHTPPALISSSPLQHPSR